MPETVSAPVFTSEMSPLVPFVALNPPIAFAPPSTVPPLELVVSVPEVTILPAVPLSLIAPEEVKATAPPWVATSS